jgi:hypothetical protein
VNAKEYLFCRWHDQDERLNIEGSSRGMNSYDDQHYMSRPHPIRKDEVELGLYLRSLPVPESFAVFLASRGHCLEDIGNRSEAILCYSLAVKHSDHPMYRGFLSRLRIGWLILESHPIAQALKAVVQRLQEEAWNRDQGKTLELSRCAGMMPGDLFYNEAHHHFQLILIAQQLAQLQNAEDRLAKRLASPNRSTARGPPTSNSELHNSHLKSGLLGVKP